MKPMPGEILWTEDVSTVLTKTHEGLFKTWKRLFNERPEMLDAVHCDFISAWETHCYMPNGKMFVLFNHTVPGCPRSSSTIQETAYATEKKEELPMTTVVQSKSNVRKRMAIDVETIEAPDLPEAAKAYIAEIAKNKKQPGFDGALIPIACNIVSIAMVNVETMQGGVYYMTPGKEGIRKVNDVPFMACSTEADLLAKFWKRMMGNSIATWNGRNFDVPVISVRSAVHEAGFEKSPYDAINLWSGSRYTTDWHADMADLVSGFGARDRLSLDTTCQVLGIQSPKVDGIDGSMVGTMWNSGKHEEIAEYNYRDAIATAKVFNRLRMLSDAHLRF